MRGLSYGVIICGLETAPALLRNVTADIAFDAVSSALDFAILSVKHMGFEEEREWRVLHRPLDYASAHVVEKVTSIGGTPQLIYQMPLVNRPGMNMPHLTLDRLLQGVIVGPLFILRPRGARWLRRFERGGGKYSRS